MKKLIKEALETVLYIPLLLAVFPIPFLYPILLIWLAIEQPEETMLAVIYFVWLIASLIYEHYR